jgi:NAD(P)H-nitrite reductase large subunit
LLEDLGRPGEADEVVRLDGALARQARFREALENAYPFPAHLIHAVADDEIVCRCEGITAGALRDAARGKDAGEVNRLKALTRIGMGRCQGRVCGHASAELLARARGVAVESVGRLRGQPPVKPIPILEGAP